MYRIHGGTIVCWRAAAGGAVGCGGGACVGVVRVVGGGVSWVVLGGSSWWFVVVVPGGWSWAWRFLGGCGTCGVGLAGGWGGRVCGLACLPSALPAVSSSAFPLLLSFRWFFLLCFFFLRGALAGVLCVGVAVCRCRRRCGCGCRGGQGSGWLLRSGFPVCAPAPRFPVCRAPVRGVLTAGGWRQWWCSACVGGRGSWVVPGWRGWPWACVWVCSWRGLMGWWAVLAWLVCVGAGYVCAEGAVGWAGARWAMQWVEEMLVTPTGGCCRRRNGFVLWTRVLRVMRRAATGLVTLMVS